MVGVAPQFILDTPEEDLPVVDAIIRRAHEMRIEYDEAFADAIASRTAKHMVKPLSDHITRLVKSLARALS